jgi:Glycoside hydrolase family 44
MSIWNRLISRFGPRADMLDFAPDATPSADEWLVAFTESFMRRPDAAHATNTLMSGLRFYTAEFVAGVASLPSPETRQPAIGGRRHMLAVGTLLVVSLMLVGCSDGLNGTSTPVKPAPTENASIQEPSSSTPTNSLDQPTPVQTLATVTQAHVSVDVGGKRQPISPFIYGMSFAADDVMRDANLTLNRIGGNGMSRYNWTLGNATNAGSDYYFVNKPLSDDPAANVPSGFADLTVKHDKSAGVETLLTVPMLGYVAKDDNDATRSTGVPSEGAGPVTPGSEAIAGYDPKQNQQTTSIRSYARKGSPFQDPPNPNADVVYQDEWIAHLTHTFGKAVAGGVRFYAMDNEPDLWADSTHVDVHPVRVGYDEMLRLFQEYSSAVKAVDPTAEVTGPVLWGWTSYFFSALDRGDDNFATAADRKAHGGMPFIPWFLDGMRKADAAKGQRTLDVLDIHYYPQADGISSGKTDSTDAALRLRSTRSLWDPSYKDESWIATAEDPYIQLIPRMKGWIDQYYPGTKLGISEWRWYAEGTMNGALAMADVLGIYGREGVYLACYWNDYGAELTVGSPGLEAFKMYRNYDGNKSTFGDVSVAAKTAIDPDKLSVYASEDTHTNQIKIIVLNKTPQEQIDTQIGLQGGNFRGPAKVYQMSVNTDLTIKAMPDVTLNGASLNVSSPPSSITLLIIDKTQ